MADQPIPDFSQTNQFAPGFQPQMPIPGISSSFTQAPQQQYSPLYNGNTSYIADQIATQSVTSSRVTMALAQQSLMNSMHTAMLGTMGAFSDITRRSGAMITSISPAGRYNDMLAPNQNWALESSFRREAGFGIANFMGLNPQTSVMSRLIQGRRPEFLTEGEYSSTMKFAGQLRQEQFMKGLASVGVGAGLSIAGTSLATGLGLGIAGTVGIGMVLPAALGLGFDRMLEAEFAESESSLKTQMMVKNKRMGIGNQFMRTGEAKKMHSSFYESDNPFAARFFGDTALGNAFKPDVQKLKIFENATSSGLMSYENLNADNVINYVNKIAADVEKFSRIGKVTRDTYQKILSNIKATGIHGNDMFASARQTANISSLTGIDMEQLSGIQDNAAITAQSYGMDNFAARESMGNIVSGFAMMQKSGAFQNKNIMQLSQGMFNYSMTNSRTALGMMARYGGLDKAYGNLGRLGNGDYGYGMVIQNSLDLPGKNPIDTYGELAKQNKWSFKQTQEYIYADPQLSAEDKATTAKAYALKYFGLTEMSEKADQIDNYVRLKGRERTSNIYDVRDLGTTGTAKGKAIVSFFDTLKYYKKGDIEGVRASSDFGSTQQAVKDVLGKYSSIDKSNIYEVTKDLGDVRARVPYSIYGIIEETDPKKWAQIKEFGAQQDRESGSGTFDAILGLMKKSTGNDFRFQEENQFEGDSGLSFTKALRGSGKRNEFITRVRDLYKQKNGSFKNVSDLIGSVRKIALDVGVDQKIINSTFGDKSLKTGLFDGNSSENFMSTMLYMSRELKEEEFSKDDQFSKYQSVMANRLGFTKGGHIDYDRYNKAIKRIQDFTETYYDREGKLKDSAINKSDNSLSDAFIKGIQALAKSKGDERKVAELYLGGSLDKLNELGQFKVPDLARVLGPSLIGKNTSFTAADLERAHDEVKKDAEKDPSDKAVENLNKLLEQILAAMNGGTPTQKK